MTGPSAIRAVIVACVLATAAPASAGATITFGADLSLVPDLSFHCNVPPPFFITNPVIPVPPTCTAFTSAIFGGGNALGPQLVPDGQGVITKLRIREPNVVSSPLKMTVLQAIRTPQSTIDVCCTVVSESPPFTPQPNTITEVTFNPPIPVHAITTVTGVYEFQAVALTATDTDSVIPAATASGHGSGAYFPAAVPGTERYEDTTSLGTSTQIEFQVDEELTAPATTGGSATDTPPAPVVAFPAPTFPTPVSPFAGKPLTVGGTGRLTGNTAAIPLVCKLLTTCTGTVRLQDIAQQGARAAATKNKAPKLYGSARFSVKAGRSASVKVALNQAGRTLLAHHTTIKLYANATLSGGQLISTKLTLRRPAKKRAKPK